MEADSPDPTVTSSTEKSAAEIRFPAMAWKRLSRALYLKVFGQLVCCIAVPGVFMRFGGPAKSPTVAGLFAALFVVGIAMDAIGRFQCLSTSLGRHVPRGLLPSVVAQILVVALMAAAFALPVRPFAEDFKEGALKDHTITAVLILLAMLSQLSASLVFVGFLQELSRQFHVLRLVTRSRTLQTFLGSAMAVTAVVVVIAPIAIILFVVTVGWLAWVGAAGLILLLGGLAAFLFGLMVLVPFVIIQVQYSILMFQLAGLTSQAAKKLDALTS